MCNSLHLQMALLSPKKTYSDDEIKEIITLTHHLEEK